MLEKNVRVYKTLLHHMNPSELQDLAQQSRECSNICRLIEEELDTRLQAMLGPNTLAANTKRQNIGTAA